MRNLYRPHKSQLGGLISHEEFDNCVDTVSVITAKVYSHNRKKDVQGIPLLLTITLALATLMVLVYFFLMFYGISDSEHSLKVIGLFLLAVSVVIISIVMIGNVMYEFDNFVTFDTMVEKSLNNYFMQLNKRFEKQGIEWSVQKQHFWLELKIDTDVADSYRKSIGYRLENDNSFEEHKHQDILKTEAYQTLQTAGREDVNEDGYNPLANLKDEAPEDLVRKNKQ